MSTVCAIAMVVLPTWVQLAPSFEIKLVNVLPERTNSSQYGLDAPKLKTCELELAPVAVRYCRTAEFAKVTNASAAPGFKVARIINPASPPCSPVTRAMMDPSPDSGW